MQDGAQTRVFQTKVFRRLCRAEGIENKQLLRCVVLAEDGLIEAELARGLIKQRLARSGEGKSGGLRTIIVFKKGVRAVFIDIFAKNRQANILPGELKAYKKLASSLLGFSDSEVEQALKAGALIEITGSDGVEDGKEANQRPARRRS